MHMIQITNVHKSFKKQKVLKEIDLHIRENEIFGLIGPSGSGKSTLVRLIIGAENADSGEIKVCDYKIPNIHVLSHIGYMPQNDALYTDISGYDNLLFFGSMYAMHKGELQKRSQELLRLVDLEKDAGKKVALYSGGMKKRLSLAISLLHRPKLLILDEPTVGIDPLLRQKIWNEFYKLKQNGTTIIVTTHVMDEATKCDRLGLIYEGTIIACDTVEGLLNRTENHTIEELFLKGGEALS